MTPEERREMLVREIRQLTAILESEGLMSFGVKGQPVPHPALRERRAALAELRQLERVMRADAGDEVDELDEFLADLSTR